MNAGSDTLTVFAVQGSDLRQRQIISSGGHLPVSVGVAHDLVYVLNAGGDGTISGFRVDHGSLNPLDDSTRSLGLGNPATPPFLAAPSQVVLTPDGRSVVVATKTHGVLDVFPLDRRGRPTPVPVVTAAAPGRREATPTPMRRRPARGRPRERRLRQPMPLRREKRNFMVNPFK